jgi:hypothetical protein
MDDPLLKPTAHDTCSSRYNWTTLANGTANTIVNDTFWLYGTLTKTLPHWGGGALSGKKMTLSAAWSDRTNLW